MINSVKKKDSLKHSCFAAQTLFQCDRCSGFTEYIESVTSAGGHYNWLCEECIKLLGRECENKQEACI